MSGRVLGPDGKPFAGARLFVVTRGAKKNDLTVQATTREDGRFSISVPHSEVGRQAKLVASADGHGPAWIEVGKRPAGPLTLRLVKDFCAQHVAEVRCAVIYEKPLSIVKCEYVWRRTDLWIDFPWSAEAPVA